MKLKRIHIKYRFIFQIVIFIIYAVLIGFIMLCVVNRIREDRQTFQTLQKLKSQLTSCHITYKDFLQNTKNGDRLYREGENTYTEEFQRKISLIRDSLNLLLSETKNGQELTETAVYDSVIHAINNYQITFRQINLLIKELGDRNTGKAALMFSSAEELSRSLQETGLPEIFAFSSQLNLLQSEYVSNPGRAKYNEILTLLNKIRYNPVLSGSDSTTVILIDIGQLVESYQGYLNEVQKIYILLTGGDNDLYTRMEIGIAKINHAFNELISLSKAMMKNHFRWLIMFGFIIITLLSILYIIQFIAFYKRFGKPLQNTIDYSFKLSKGKLSDTELDIEVPFEISHLNENLNRIGVSIKEKKTFVDSLLKQKFDIELNLQGKNDTFGKTLIALKENMRKAREEQIKHAEDNQIRRFQNEGIAKFADILRNNSDNLDKLSDIFIMEIVKYLDAIQGGLFLLENDNETLKLVATFAYNRKKYITKTLKKGESLVGTCALEKKTILLADMPDEYIEITSGLGDAPPNNLLLLPIMHEDQLIGVLEIASLNKFNTNQISLGEKITASLASTIINARINAQTSELLQKSQQQAAEMAEQEEEMRQNMEELKATQEESARREEELESILHAIDQSFYVLEYDIEGVITKVNQRFLYLVNMPMDKVIGQKHNQLFGKGSKADSLLFANIAEGNIVELIEKVNVNKKPLEIKNTFSPIRKKDGETVKILNIMIVII